MNRLTDGVVRGFGVLVGLAGLAWAVAAGWALRMEVARLTEVKPIDVTMTAALAFMLVVAAGLCFGLLLIAVLGDWS
ncbi:MAG TPA: hypothetical protein VF841_17275 [Anaeromyxobacter sp.]